MKRFLLVVPLVFLACSVVRQVSLPAPSTSEHPTPYPALLVTDAAGHRQWVYNAFVENDTLWGVRNPQVSKESIALPLSYVKSVGAARFSSGRTAGLFGSLAGLVIAAVLLAPNPDFVIVN